MKTTLIGAGGKMGMRLANNLNDSSYQMAYLEIDVEGKEKLSSMGIKISQDEKVIPESDIVICEVVACRGWKRLGHMC